MGTTGTGWPTPDDPDVFDGKCEYCGDDAPVKKTPDPFSEEIYGNSTEHVICAFCYYQSCVDI